MTPPPTGTISWASLAADLSRQFGNAGIERADHEARLIVSKACGTEPSEWLDMADRPATQRGLAAIDAMATRRLAGEPLQYVLGEWSFRYLDLFVDRRVLIPRPETEIVADVALTVLERQAPDGSPILAADLGTGSGAIGLALATEHTGVEIWLTDRSPDALAVARANLAGAGWTTAGRVTLAEGFWFEALPPSLAGNLGLVVSNPPYVADDDDLPAEVTDWEPTGALIAGPDGTEDLAHLIAEAPRWLRPDGALVLELAPHQAQPMAAAAAPLFADVEIRPDLTGRDRVLLVRHPRPS